MVGCDVEAVGSIEQIPFLPIEFFKGREIISFDGKSELIFRSSGTKDGTQSQHFVYKKNICEDSFVKSFQLFYGEPSDYVILGLLPSYLERKGSSLVYMVDHLIKLSGKKESGFYLKNYPELVEVLAGNRDQKIFLIGVSYELMDLAEQFKPNLNGQIVIETGGMKGERKEIPKEELHEILKSKFNLDHIHSEYGMTELLSQAYSKGDGVFECPPWMKIVIREYNDPFTYTNSKSGGINVIDLANIYSCSFIATDDLGRIFEENKKKFKVLGRLDNSDFRGCNLLLE